MKTIEENNRLIAEFMSSQKVTTHHNQYHVSWNELMSVVEKIEELEDGRFDVNILKNGTQIFEFSASGRLIVDNVANISFYEKIEHIYDAVVKFIKWYNKQKQIKL